MPRKKLQRRFSQNEMAEKGLVLRLCTKRRGSTARFHSTVVGTEVPAVKQLPLCQSLIGLSMQKLKRTTPKNRKKNEAPRSFKTHNQDSQNDVEEERRAMRTIHVPCKCRMLHLIRCCQQGIQPLILSWYVKPWLWNLESYPVGSLGQIMVLLAISPHKHA